ncbi:hypothetical protein HY224_01960 [Candidatus Uhrbacteria bacterium]|nr:hypothetical protein [Candidatus Uhrbacteria bacterium]
MNFQEFQKKYMALLASMPKKPNTVINCENSDYGDVIVRCRNVYYGFDAVESENSFYIYDCYQNKNLIDCSYVAFSQLCHESQDCDNCYNSSYLNFCTRCTNCFFCYSCKDCQDCLGYYELKSQKFCFLISN